MPYLIRDTLPTTEFICRRLKIPATLDILIAVSGALEELTHAENWESMGSVTPEEIALAMDTMYQDYRKDSACMIGSIVLYAVNTLPSGVLACDGSGYARVDYQRLYDVLSSDYIVDADNFTVPDLYQGSDLKYGIVAQ